MATLEMPRNYVRLWKLSHHQRTGVGPLRMTVILWDGSQLSSVATEVKI